MAPADPGKPPEGATNGTVLQNRLAKVTATSRLKPTVSAQQWAYQQPIAFYHGQQNMHSNPVTPEKNSLPQASEKTTHGGFVLTCIPTAKIITANSSAATLQRD
jgi:hypothetical protein